LGHFLRVKRCCQVSKVKKLILKSVKVKYDTNENKKLKIVSKSKIQLTNVKIQNVPIKGVKSKNCI